ncbi:hypothetical protein L7F22_065367 [Adiantum nelumboides]|nr:hypothetical protein [Adiantum nelumboides]
MWRLKQLIPKEQAGLEGKTVEVGSLKLQIRSVIAEGGFSCVYLARDAQSGRQFALKHIVCNDSESLDLVKKEVSALKTLRGHPNIVTLHAQAMYDMGRTKECFIVTEYCDKMMVEVLDSRGGGFFEEKQLLLMFRDICNAVYALHCLLPPMAHRLISFQCHITSMISRCLIMHITSFGKLHDKTPSLLFCRKFIAVVFLWVGLTQVVLRSHWF